MLQSIRSKASSFPVKVLFGILIVAFGAGIWSTAGSVFRTRSIDTSVAHVGDLRIEANDLRKAVRDLAEAIRQSRGLTEPLTPDDMKNLGVVDSALQQLVNRDLLTLETERLRLAVGDAALDQIIRGTFHDTHGGFDAESFHAYLGQHGQSQQQFEAALRRDIIQDMLDRALIAGVTAPPPLVDALYRSRAERRTAELVAVPATAVPAPAAPSDAEIEAYYAKHKDDSALAVPALRSFSIALLLLDDVAAQIKPTDEELKDAYDKRLDEFRSPPMWHFQQMVLPDEAKAKDAATALAEGKDFAAVAEEIAHTAKDKIDIGNFRRGELLPPLNDAAFALKPGETTQPIQTTFGWHILRLVEAVPERTKSFDEVKDALAKDVAREQAGDRISAMEPKIEDDLAGGASIADIAVKYKLKLSTVENVDENGLDPEGKPVALPAGADVGTILTAAFKRNEPGPVGQLNELGDGNFYLMRVDKVTPKTARSLDAVKAKIVDAVVQEKRNEALRALAKEMTDAINGGKPIAEVASAHQLAVTTSAPLTRRSADAKTPPGLVTELFDAKPGGAVFAFAGDGYIVAQVKEVLPPDAAQQDKQTADFSAQIAPALRDDMLEEFGTALRSRYPVTTNQEAVDALSNGEN